MILILVNKKYLFSCKAEHLEADEAVEAHGGSLHRPQHAVGEEPTAPCVCRHVLRPYAPVSRIR